MVDATGLLIERWHPAVYLDTQMLIDFELAYLEYYDLPESERTMPLSREAMAAREVFRNRRNRGLEGMINIRRRLMAGNTRVQLVSSPLADIEMGEFFTDAGMRELLIEAFGPRFLRGRDTHKIMGSYVGDLLRKFPPDRAELFRAEEPENLARSCAEALAKVRESISMRRRALAEPLGDDGQTKKLELQLTLAKLELEEMKLTSQMERLRGDQRRWSWSGITYQFGDKVWDALTWSAGHGPVRIAPIVAFGIHACCSDGPLRLMSALQIGAADVLHVLFAHHLGCSYFASSDSDFERAEDLLKVDFGLTLLKDAKSVEESL
jgi:hypothetical protein